MLNENELSPPSLIKCRFTPGSFVKVDSSTLTSACEHRSWNVEMGQLCDYLVISENQNDFQT